jgi:hypothetical protein
MILFYLHYYICFDICLQLMGNICRWRCEDRTSYQVNVNITTLRVNSYFGYHVLLWMMRRKHIYLHIVIQA